MRKPRTRLVNFRVTDEEFERLKAACDSVGARCLSDFARSLMLGNGDRASAPAADDNKLISFHRRLEVLERDMTRVAAELADTQAQLSRQLKVT